MTSLNTGAMRLPRRLRARASASLLSPSSPSPRPPPICRACRAFSSAPTPSSQSPPPPPTSGYSRLTSRRLISVSGPDAAKYLQGVITANIAAPDGNPRRQGFYSAFLSSQGRVLHDVFVYPDNISGQEADPTHSFLVEVDAAEAEKLVRHIKRYKLRARFAVRLLDGEEGGVWHAWDDGSRESGLELGEQKAGSIVLRDPRSPTLGYRVVTAGPSSATGTPPELLGMELDAAPEEAYRIRRYLHGIPEGQSEILYESALPLESNMDVMGGIDFHKGCYVGQELTIRTKHRGVVRKRILPCVVYGEGDAGIKPEDRELAYRPDLPAVEGGFATAEEIPASTSIGRVGKKGRSAGKWLSGVGNVGLALCRLEIMTDVVLPGEANASAFSPADEFLLAEKLEGDEESTGRQARIKAFVPLWLRQGLAGATPRP